MVVKGTSMFVSSLIIEKAKLLNVPGKNTK